MSRYDALSRRLLYFLVRSQVWWRGTGRVAGAIVVQGMAYEWSVFYVRICRFARICGPANDRAGSWGRLCQRDRRQAYCDCDCCNEAEFAHGLDVLSDVVRFETRKAWPDLGVVAVTDVDEVLRNETTVWEERCIDRRPLEAGHRARIETHRS